MRRCRLGGDSNTVVERVDRFPRASEFHQDKTTPVMRRCVPVVNKERLVKCAPCLIDTGEGQKGGATVIMTVGAGGVDLQGMIVRFYCIGEFSQILVRSCLVVKRLEAVGVFGNRAVKI